MAATTGAGASGLLYQRVLLKLSGEALMGKGDFGIDMAVAERLARDIAEAIAAGAQISVVVGGGNIFRGLAGAAKGMERATADYMGMLATVMNALALQNALENAKVPARVLSAIPMPTVCESYVRPKALHHMGSGRVVIFAAGTGNPFFTTDTAATLRAIEMDCQVVAKATQVDGVYDSDPRKNPAAKRYDRLDLCRGFVARSQGDGRRGNRPCSRQRTSGNCLLDRRAGQLAESAARQGTRDRHRVSGVGR